MVSGGEEPLKAKSFEANSFKKKTRVPFGTRVSGVKSAIRTAKKVKKIDMTNN